MQHRTIPTQSMTDNAVLATPPSTDYQQLGFSAKAKAIMYQLVAVIFGDATAEKVKFGSCRVCWHLSTVSEDFVVSKLGNSPGERVDGLYMATAGSYHGFRFLPIIGKYMWSICWKTGWMRS